MPSGGTPRWRARRTDPGTARTSPRTPRPDEARRPRRPPIPRGDRVRRGAACRATPPGRTSWRDLYFSGTTSVFVLHGNVHDYVHAPEPDEDGGGRTSASPSSSRRASSAPGTSSSTTTSVAGLRPARRQRQGAAPRRWSRRPRPSASPRTGRARPTRCSSCSTATCSRTLLTDAGDEGARAARARERRHPHPARAVRRARGGHRGPGAPRTARGSCACSSWAQNPYLKRLQHRLLPDRGQAERGEQPPRPEPVRRHGRDPDARRRGARALRRAGPRGDERLREVQRLHAGRSWPRSRTA